MCETTVTVGFWNILAEGLSAGEFMSPTDGENVALWANRGPRIVEAMSNMFAKGCALIGVVENDKPRYLLAELKKKHPKIACVHVIKGEYQKTNAFKINTKNTADLVWPGGKESDFSQFHETAYNNAKTSAQEEYTRIAETYNDRARLRGPCGIDDDGMSIYFLTDRVSLMDNENTTISGRSICGYDMVQNTKPFFTWSFQSAVTRGRCQNPQVFKVTVGHLKSGEDEEGALRRVEELYDMFHNGDSTVGADSIVLMDSNFSNHYPGATLSKTLFSSRGYTDIVPDEGYECFKMRHARGGQPCEFMFDRIDRILIPEGARAELLDPVIAPYDATHSKKLQSLRTNKTERDALNSACRAERWVTPNDKYMPHLKELYPNNRLPSDHMPIMATVTLPSIQ